MEIDVPREKARGHPWERGWRQRAIVEGPQAVGGHSEEHSPSGLLQDQPGKHWAPNFQSQNWRP